MARRPVFLLSTIPSDAHTWNLVYVDLLLQENKISTVNLGPCTPFEKTISSVARLRPDVLIISTVNGHGLVQIKTLLTKARRRLGEHLPPVLVGGKLSTAGTNSAVLKRKLSSMGVQASFFGDEAVPEFLRWLMRFKRRRAAFGKQGKLAGPTFPFANHHQ